MYRYFRTGHNANQKNRKTANCCFAFFLLAWSSSFHFRTFLKPEFDYYFLEQNICSFFQVFTRFILHTSDQCH